MTMKKIWHVRAEKYKLHVQDIVVKLHVWSENNMSMRELNLRSNLLISIDINWYEGVQNENFLHCYYFHFDKHGSVTTTVLHRLKNISRLNYYTCMYDVKGKLTHQLKIKKKICFNGQRCHTEIIWESVNKIIFFQSFSSFLNINW